MIEIVKTNKIEAEEIPENYSATINNGKTVIEKSNSCVDSREHPNQTLG